LSRLHNGADALRCGQSGCVLRHRRQLHPAARTAVDRPRPLVDCFVTLALRRPRHGSARAARLAAEPGLR
jgi:hypothetical protein